MNWFELLSQIFEVCIIPLLGVLTGCLITFIKKKAEELKEKTDNEMYKKYIRMLETTVTNCVIATKQTYVEALKDENAFTPEAQKKAFSMCYNMVVGLLTDEAKVYLEEATGDLQDYITELIEAQVNINK